MIFKTKVGRVSLNMESTKLKKQIQKFKKIKILSLLNLFLV